MAEDVILQALTQAVFVLLFVFTLVGFIRRRDLARLEIAALFGSVAFIVLLQAVVKLSDIQVPVAGLVGALLLLAQPYLLLRLVAHFRPLTWLHHAIALLCMVGSWVPIIIASGDQLAPLGLLVVVVLFASVEGFASAAFIRAAATSRGVLKRRLMAVATGSILLAVVLLMAAFTTALSLTGPEVRVASDVLALGSALSYYLGFALPGWLRRAWQMAEVRRYLVTRAQLSAEDRMAGAPDYTAPVAARALGAKAAVLALADEAGSETLKIHASPGDRAALEDAGLSHITLGPHSSMLTACWRERRSVAADQAEWGETGRALAAALGGGRTQLVSPLLAHGRAVGLLILLFDAQSPFLADELGLLDMLAEQAALVIDGSRLYLAARGNVARQEALLEQLADSEARHRQIIEGALDAVVSMDASGAITGWNHQAEAMFGWTLEEALGRTVEATIIPPQHRGAHHRGLENYRATGEAPVLNQLLELTALSRDGREFPVDLAITAVQRDEGPSFTAFIRDISVRKSAERQLQEALAKLESQNVALGEASRLKSEFLANMSHELRTPLNGIIGFAQLMRDGKVGDVSEDHLEYLGYILSSADHLLKLINDVLDLSKVEAGKMDFHPEPVDLSKLLTEAMDSLHVLADEKRIAVQVSVDGALGTVVLDAGKLTQILNNYISNALKFTSEGGRVAVRAVPEGKDYFRIEVEDTGIGIAPEDVDRLFSEFQQLQQGADKRYPGTGLGLALTKRIAEAQGGRVGVTSVAGHGSTFFAVLPRVSRTEPERPLPAKALPARSGAPSVLVVEDDDKDRDWLQAALAGAGYRVEGAANGTQAIAACAERRFDAVTLDLLLPDMHGWEVLKEMRAGALNSDVPIVVVTMLADKGLAAGFAIQDFLTKPIRPEELLASLQRLGVMPGEAQGVLIVDDDPTALRLMEATLQQLGYTAICASDGAAGLQLAAESVPAAVVLDLLMPEMDGFQFLDRFRRTHQGRRTPVIVWTSKELSAEERERLRALAQAVVIKGRGGTAPLLKALKEHLSSTDPGKDHASVG